MDKKFSKTIFIILSFLIFLIIIGSLVVGFISNKILGAIGIGWSLATVLIIILLCLSDKDYVLNDDFQWKFSK